MLHVHPEPLAAPSFSDAFLCPGIFTTGNNPIYSTIPYTAEGITGKLTASIGEGFYKLR
jgi:hypothetical protein